MPIYEFYCADCHTIFNFLSKTVNTTARPLCPRCGKRKLERQVSLFAMTRKTGEGDEAGDLPVSEEKMEHAIEALASEAENINEDDPRQAATLMRKFTKMTGLGLSDTMEEALGRMEAGEDPEKIEEEMGDLMENDEEPFVFGEQKKRRAVRATGFRGAPARDETLYEL
ncbi:MAG: zinc ribbon domain-containing protein [Kiritimatiellae bacterium]|nr:zinc ribbon domain-containing protein [Kiritimatiellia bacterium]